MMETITIEAVTFPWVPYFIGVAVIIVVGVITFHLEVLEVFGAMLVVFGVMGIILSGLVASTVVNEKVQEQLVYSLEESGYANIEVERDGNFTFTGSFKGEYRNGILTPSGVTDEYFVIETPVD